MTRTFAVMVTVVGVAILAAAATAGVTQWLTVPLAFALGAWGMYEWRRL